MSKADTDTDTDCRTSTLSAVLQHRLCKSSAIIAKISVGSYEGTRTT